MEASVTAGDAGDARRDTRVDEVIPERGPAAYAAELIGTFMLVLTVAAVVSLYVTPPVSQGPGAPRVLPATEGRRERVDDKRDGGHRHQRHREMQQRAGDGRCEAQSNHPLRRDRDADEGRADERGDRSDGGERRHVAPIDVGPLPVFGERPSTIGADTGALGQRITAAGA